MTHVTVDGKFFALDGARFPFRGVTYGTFAPRGDGERYPERDRMKIDLAAMQERGFTVVRTYTEPTDDLLDLAADSDLRILAGVFYPDWRYLMGSSRREQRRVLDEARRTVAAAAERVRDDDRVLALVVGNEIPADVVRWFGTRKIANAISTLVDEVKSVDADRLVTYANFPTTEYLPLDDLDFLTFNLFLEDEESYRRYLTRLQHLAGDRPLVLGEVGIDASTTRAGEIEQARALDWMLSTAVERGVGGTCAFSWTDEWWVGDAAVDGWHFGLTRADRTPRLALEIAESWNERSVRDLRFPWPSMSVVVCAYNAEATLDECLRHTCALDYPNLDVIVVDDGSTDATAGIVRRHPRARLVTIAHQGLSAARNEGLRHARGDLVAYLDSDAYPTPEWPWYLALAFDGRTVGGAGGPNVSPPDASPGAQQVAHAPGGPVHVLLSDDRAEHVPGCNMAFWKPVVEAVGGFDPVYTSAGDDVDLCWKVLDRGWEIGFHPAALVWHHRRSGLRPYLRQQRGYGRSEALVEARHPDRFTRTGTARWRGRIYNSFAPAPVRQRIYRGMFGTAPFQSAHASSAHHFDVAHQVGVPLLTGALATAPLALVRQPWGAPALLSLVLLAALFLIEVIRARPVRGDRSAALRFRGGVAAMHILQPLARTWGRLRFRTQARREAPAPTTLPALASPPCGSVLVFVEDRERDRFAADVAGHLHNGGFEVVPGIGWEDHDMRLYGSWLVAGDLATTRYPEGCLQLRIRRRVRPAACGVLLAAVVATAAIGVGPAALVLAVATVDVGLGAWRTGPRARRVLLAAAAKGQGPATPASPSTGSSPPSDTASADPDSADPDGAEQLRWRGALRRSLASWPRVLPYVRPYRKLVAASFVLMVLAAIVSLAEPWPMALLVDSVLGNEPLPGQLEGLVPRNTATRITFAVGLGLLVTLLVHSLAAVIQYVNTKLEMGMVLEFRSQMFQHVQRLSFAYHDDRRTGELMGRINNQASSVGNVTVAVFPLLQSALTLIGMFWVAYRLNPPVALVSLTIVPFIYLSTGYYGSRIGPEVRKVKGMEMRSLHIVHEAVQMLRVIVAFNREDLEYRRFRDQGEEAVDARVKLTVRQMLFSLAVNLITAGGTAAVLGVGAWQVIDGQLTTGQLLVLISYIAAVYKPLQTISTTVNTIQEQLIGFEMALEVLETQPEVIERPGAVAIGRARGHIAFRSVEFHYPGREHTLSNLTFDVPPGSSVGVVGPTGAGKTTMVSLLPRFYDPDAGSIHLDGRDIRDLTLGSLRQQMSIVLQEALLFSGTIGDNIRYGRLDASQEEVREAAKAANAHKFIAELPKRYATSLGERGAKLSGGERQRIAVARAFLKDAPILILDEPTSAIDSQTESVILEALRRLMEGRTTFMIAHRLSTVRDADLILVMNEGKLVEAGTHDQLVERGGLYKTLHLAQTERPAARVDALLAKVARTNGGSAPLTLGSGDR